MHPRSFPPAVVVRCATALVVGALVVGLRGGGVGAGSEEAGTPVPAVEEVSEPSLAVTEEAGGEEPSAPAKDGGAGEAGGSEAPLASDPRPTEPPDEAPDPTAEPEGPASGATPDEGAPVAAGSESTAPASDPPPVFVEDAPSRSDLALPGSTDVEAISIPLDEVDDSSVSGIATLLARGDSRTEVLLQVDGGGVVYQAGIYAGTCEEIGERTAELTEVGVDGNSESDVPIGLAELLGGGSVIVITEDDDPVACGFLGGIEANGDGTGMETPAPPATPDALTTTGVGTTAFGSRNGSVLWLGVLAVAIGVVGLALRVRGVAPESAAKEPR